MAMRCYRMVWCFCKFAFCKIVARWVYKNTRVRWNGDALLSNGLMVCSFVKSLQDSRRQLVPILDKPAFSRIPLNSEPRIVVKIFGKFVKRQVCSKWGLVADGCCKMGLQNTNAWDEMRWRCVAISGLMLCSFVKSLQDGLTKTHACDAMCWFFWVAYYLL